MAAGALFAAYALAVAATAVLVVVTVRLVASGDARFEAGVPARVLLAAGFAAADAALLVVATKRWAALRPLTVALAVVVSIAWPLSGIPLPAAALAVLAVGLAATRDRARPGGSRVDERTVATGLSIAAAVLLIAGAAAATTRPARETTPAAKRDAAAGSREAGPNGAAARAKRPDAAASDEAAATALGGDRDPAASSGTAARGVSSAGAAQPGTSAAESNSPTAAPDNGAGGDSPPAGTKLAPRAGTDSPTAAPDEGAGGDAPGGGAGAGTPARDGSGAASAERFVRRYYRALDEHRFRDAWKSLTPAIRERFGGFTPWRAGYAKTRSHRLREVTVTTANDLTSVGFVLAARAKGCAGEQRFRVAWRLRADGSAWSVADVAASVLAEGDCR